MGPNRTIHWGGGREHGCFNFACYPNSDNVGKYSYVNLCVIDIIKVNKDKVIAQNTEKLIYIMTDMHIYSGLVPLL